MSSLIIKDLHNVPTLLGKVHARATPLRPNHAGYERRKCGVAGDGAGPRGIVPHSVDGEGRFARAATAACEDHIGRSPSDWRSPDGEHLHSVLFQPGIGHEPTDHAIEAKGRRSQAGLRPG